MSALHHVRGLAAAGGLATLCIAHLPTLVDAGFEPHALFAGILCGITLRFVIRKLDLCTATRPWRVTRGCADAGWRGASIAAAGAAHPALGLLVACAMVRSLWAAHLAGVGLSAYCAGLALWWAGAQAQQYALALLAGVLFYLILAEVGPQPCPMPGIGNGNGER